MNMKRSLIIATAGAVCFSAGAAVAQQGNSSPPPVAGRVPLGVSVAEMEHVVVGWSAKKDLLGKTVTNDKNDKIGKIDDIIITPKNSVSFAIIGVGGFIGIAKRDVAIPIEQIKLTSGNLVLAGATKDAVKALPPFEYAKK
jgi:sporulation protein YlmC with PRC-barrel domain